MKRLILLLSTSLYLIGNTAFGQSVHYFGTNPSYNHYPQDLLQTQNGDLLLLGGVNWASGAIENFAHSRYLVRTDGSGGMLWENYVGQPWYAGGNLVEMPSGGLFTFGQNEGSNVCVSSAQTFPFNDYSVQIYSASGDSLSTVIQSDYCDDKVRDWARLGTTSYAFMASSDQNYAYHYSIKSVHSNGSFTSTTLSSIPYFSTFDRVVDGYLFAKPQLLLKTDLTGNILWQQPISLPNYVSDFLQVDNDSIVFLCSDIGGIDPDTMILVKSDGFGNVGWQRGFPAKSWNVIHHSSGAYVVAGIQGNQIAVVAIDPTGNIAWTRLTPINSSPSNTKTIELSDGRIATLGYSGGWGQSGQLVLILDSLDMDCASSFEVYPDSIPYHYTAVNMATSNDSLQYSWEWGDGNTDVGAYPNHTYDSIGTYDICLTITSASGCTDTYCEDLTFKAPTPMGYINVVPSTWLGVENPTPFPIEDLKIYPNPSDGYLSLSGVSGYSGMMKLQVVNVFGQSVLESEKEVMSGTFSEELNLNVPSGMYYIRMIVPEGQRTLSFNVIR